MGKCPSNAPGLNCPYVGCCPYGEPCLIDDEVEKEDEYKKNYDELLVWSISSILSHYANSDKIDKNELYAKAVLINTKIGYGTVYVLDDFIRHARAHYFMDSDGCGEALNADGNIICIINCDVKYLQSLKDKGCVYIAWYNK